MSHYPETDHFIRVRFHIRQGTYTRSSSLLPVLAPGVPSVSAFGTLVLLRYAAARATRLYFALRGVKTALAMIPRRVTPLLLLIVLAGVLLRAGLALYSGAVSRDTCSFVWYAQDLQDSIVQTLRDQDQHPLYPGLILAAHLVTGPLFTNLIVGWQAAAQAVSILAGGGIALTVYWLASLLFDRRTAILAALFAVVLPEGVQFSADGLSDLPHACLFVPALAAGISAIQNGRKRMWVWSGLLGGLAFLTRPEGAEVVIVIAITACTVKSVLPRRERFLGAAFMLAVAAILCVPYMAVTGKLVPKKDVFQLLGAPSENESATNAGAKNSLGFYRAESVSMPWIRAVGEVLLNWVRTSRVVYALLALSAFAGASRVKADKIAQRCALTAWGLHFTILIALVINFEYLGALSKRHTLLLVLLLLPYSAAGAVRLIDSIVLRCPSPTWRPWVMTAVLAAIVAPTVPWMLRPINPGTEFMIRAGEWIAHRQAELGLGENGVILTGDNRIPFYAGMKMKRWPDRTGDLGMLEHHIRDFGPDWVVIDERRVIKASPEFFREMNERLVNSGRLEPAHRISSDDTPTTLWIYRVRSAPLPSQ